MSCLVLEGNMILISGVSGASPTSLLSVNFLFGSWPDKEFTLSRETSAYLGAKSSDSFYLIFFEHICVKYHYFYAIPFYSTLLLDSVERDL